MDWTHLTGKVIGAVNELTERAQELWPLDNLSLVGDGTDERASRGSDQGRPVTHGRQALGFDIVLGFCRETSVMIFDVIFQNEASNGAGRLVKEVVRLELGQDKHEVVVEV